MSEKKSSYGSSDLVTRPGYYREGWSYEPKDVIRDWDLNFNLGNAVKYIARAGRKGARIEDLRKAGQYVQFEIEHLENRDCEQCARTSGKGDAKYAVAYNGDEKHPPGEGGCWAYCPFSFMVNLGEKCRRQTVARRAVR